MPALTGDWDLSTLSDLWVRVGRSPGAYILDPLWLADSLKRKLGKGWRDTLDQPVSCLMFLLYQAWISLLSLPEPRAKEKCLEG